MPVLTRPLRPEDDRQSFQSGDPDLDRFFHRFAGQNQFKHHVGATWVVVENDSILGFATVAAAELVIDALPVSSRKGLPRYPLPVLRLARLAVDLRARGRGIGSALMKVVFVLAHRMADDFGCVGVLVDAKPPAIPFHERLGFERLEILRGGLGDRPEPTVLFLELGAIPRPDLAR